MNATGISGLTKEWLAGLFGTQQKQRAHRWVRPVEELAEAGSMVLADLASEFVEQRVRAATSGFEMGEYVPVTRRN